MARTTEPFDQIVAAEQDLRGLVETVLTQQLGTSWLTQSGLTDERLVALDQRRDEEAKRRPGVLVDQSPLRYAQFFELKIIIDHHWTIFKPILGDKKRFDVYFARLESFRNAPAHSRELLPFERSLVEGISGEIRNVVTLYRSTMDSAGQYYPIIESIRDNFGNEYVAGQHEFGTVFTGTRLVVGQVVEFNCKGWEPQSRSLTWIIELSDIGMQEFERAEGGEVRLRATVEEAHVSENMRLAIVLTSSGKYHRYGQWDDICTFHYAVDPPG